MWSVLGLVAVVALLVWVFNRLVALRNRYQNSFAQIDVQLKRRHDLIPNLVETAKAYLKHERETLEGVMLARNGAVSGLQAAAANPGDPKAMARLAESEGVLGQALARFQMTVEAYPELQASLTMQQLTEELTSTENRVAFARQGYNDAVMEYNSYRQSIPAVFVASFFGHRNDAALLTFADAEQIQHAPKVSF